MASWLAGVTVVLEALDHQERSAIDRCERTVGRYREIPERRLLAGSTGHTVRVAHAGAGTSRGCTPSS
jgi:hypothetical protein